jgi:hypothetical protein
MNTCIREWMCTCVFICVCKCMPLCIHLHVCMCLCTCIYLYPFVYSFICAYMCVHMCTCVYTCVCLCVCLFYTCMCVGLWSVSGLCPPVSHQSAGSCGCLSKFSHYFHFLARPRYEWGCLISTRRHWSSLFVMPPATDDHYVDDSF